MVLIHNLSAMNSNRMLNINDRKKASTTEKLASGYRINRAADDAAGLAISEKMRRQIRGLSQASANASEGISLVQLADGAMQEIHEMLQRGNELCVKAANGTLNDIDREYIQDEIENLKIEIDQLSYRTEFNEIKVLRGEEEIKGEVSPGNAIVKGGLPDWVDIDQDSQGGYLGGVYKTTETFIPADGSASITETINHAASKIDFSQYTGTADQKKELNGQGIYTTCCTCSNHYSIKFSNGGGDKTEQSGQHYIYTIDISNISSGKDLVDKIIDYTGGNPLGHYTNFVSDTSGELIIYDNRSMDSRPGSVQNVSGSWQNWRYPQFNVKSGGSYGTFGSGVAYSGEDFLQFRQPISMFIQVGAEAGQHLDIELPEITCLAMGIDTVDVLTQESAGQAIPVFKKAIEYVNEERSRMGAYQNRLEHTVKNLDNVVENTQAAESLIRDADMAEEMVRFSNMNILAQAGQAMLAQANQMNQGVLSLIQ